MRHITNIPACIKWLEGIWLPKGFHLYPGVRILDWNKYRDRIIIDLLDQLERQGNRDTVPYTARYYMGALQADVQRIFDIVGLPSSEADKVQYEHRAGYKVVSEAPP